MTQHDLGDGVILHTRDEWALGRAVIGDPGSRAVASINEFIVHHTGGVTLGDPDPFQWARNIYDYHVHTRLYSAEAYEAFVALHNGQPIILEGRPIGLVSAATYQHNTFGYAACYLRANGDVGEDGIVPEPVKRAYRKLAQVIAWTVGHTLVGTDHHDCSSNSTACPDPDLIGWVRSGGLWEQFGPQPGPHPAPAPAPTPPPPHNVWPAWPGVDLKVGSRGGLVAIWQSQLNHRDFAGLAVDGQFGPLTDAATRHFQASRHLVTDGIVGPITWAAAG